jgi:hypothetical protein
MPSKKKGGAQEGVLCVCVTTLFVCCLYMFVRICMHIF